MRLKGARRRGLIVFSGLLCLAVQNSYAQSATDQMSNLVSANFIASLIDSVLGKNLISAFTSGGMTISTGLLTGAKIIAGTIALASMLWGLIKAHADHESPMAVIVESLLFAMVTAVLLSMYSQIVSNVADFGTWVTGAIGGSLGSSVTNLFGSIIKAIGAAMAKLSNGAPSGMSFWSGGFSNIIDSVLSFIVLIVALLFVVGAIVELVSVILLGPVIFGLAIAFGPIFIATIPSGWTRAWFNHWWNFLISGALLYAVAVAVVQLVSTAIGAAIQTPPAGGGTILIGQALAMALVCRALGSIFAQIPRMSDGLFPGRHGLSQAKGSAFPIANPVQNAQQALSATGSAGVKIGSGIAALGGEAAVNAAKAAVIS